LKRQDFAQFFFILNTAQYGLVLDPKPETEPEPKLFQSRNNPTTLEFESGSESGHMFSGIPDPNPLVRDTDPDPDPSIIKQK
jgi:hypothetical protein